MNTNSISSKNKADLFFSEVFLKSYGFILSRSIYAITKLGVAEALGDNPISVANIAQKLGIKHPENLERLMNFLASQGILAKSEEGQFSHTSMSKDLAWDRSGKKIVHYHDLRWDRLATGEVASLQALEEDGAAENAVECLSRLFVRARAIYIACRHNVFEKMQQGQPAPAVLKRHLEEAGLMANGYLTESGMLFLDSNCKAFVLHDTEQRWRSLGRLGEAVKEGTIPFEEYTKSGFFERLQTHPDELQTFSGAMAFISDYECRRLIPSLKQILAPSMTVMDVGGGTGRYLQEILSAFPDVQGILFDLPETIEAATFGETIKPRCTLHGGNFFKSVPAADVYLFKRVLHDWSNQECVRILQTCAAAAKPNARLVLHEFVLPQPEALMIDVYFMSLFKGRQRPQGEFAAILKEAGWKMISCDKTACWLGQIVAVREP